MGIRGASFHLKAVTRPAGTGVHNLRQFTADQPAPKYLLPEPNGGIIEVIDGDVASRHAAKMALASRQAKQDPKYSPVWEGVLNLDPDLPADELTAQVEAFCADYEGLTKHKVVQAVIHLDEGDPGPPVRINGHAHVVVDRTNAEGRAILLNKETLRKVQDLAAQATGLERGEDARETKAKHIDHQAYRAGARAGRIRGREDLEADQSRIDRAEKRVQAVKIKAEKVAQMAAVYGEIRGLMTASGEARQADYQELKARAKDDEFLREQLAIWEKKAEQKKAAARDTELALKVAESVAADQRAELQKQQVLIEDLKSKPAESDRWRDAVFEVASKLSAKTAHQVWWVMVEIAKTAGSSVPSAWSVAYDRARRSRGLEK